MVRFRYDLSICSPPFVGADQVFAQPTRAFTSGLPSDWLPAPSPGITTGATGQVPLAGLSPARTPTSIAATGLPVCSPPRSLLPLQVTSQGSRGFLHPSRTCVVTFARIGLAIRPTTGNWRNEDFHLARFGRGRDDDCSPPPARTRAGATNAHGSYLGCLASKQIGRAHV